MSNKQDYETKLAEITAVADDHVKIPGSIPVDAYIQEAENLYIWCQEDQAQLTAKGLDWNLVEDIAARSGALGRAQALWNREWNTLKESEKLWKEKAPIAYKLRDDLIKDFRFAYRNDEDLTGKVRDIAEGRSHADMIQDLNDLVALGEKHPEPLAAINFDMTLLDQADQLADEMAALYAAAISERAALSEAKNIRDKAYTYLKEVVDEVYDFGQYVFRDNEERLKGYRSNYLRRLRSKRKSGSEPTAVEVPEAPVEQGVSEN